MPRTIASRNDRAASIDWTSALRIEPCHGLSGIERVAANWQRLSAMLDRPSYVHLWQLQHCFVKSLASSPADITFWVFHEGPTAVAILPLLSEARRPSRSMLRRLRLLTHAHVSHGDFLVDPRVEGHFDLITALESLQKHSGTRWDEVVLGPTLEDSAVTRLVRRAQPPQPVAFDRYRSATRGHSDALTLPAGETLSPERLSRNFLAGLRKSRNKLAQLDGVEFLWAKEAADLQVSFEHFLRVEASGWKGATGTGSAIALHPHLREFYGGLVEELGPTGRLRINLLVHGARPIAGQFCLIVGDRYYVLKIGYDEEYRHVAPGNLLLEQLLRAAEREPGVRHVDLVTDAQWHGSWRPAQRQVLSHTVTGLTASGLLARAGSTTVQALRPAVRCVRGAVHRIRKATRWSRMAVSSHPE